MKMQSGAQSVDVCVHPPLSHTRNALDRLQLFIKRMELSEDPASKEYLRVTNAQMLNGGQSAKHMVPFSSVELHMWYCVRWKIIFAIQRCEMCAEHDC
jgi:hypothetical protein